jgi:hypothetical protein
LMSGKTRRSLERSIPLAAVLWLSDLARQGQSG